MLGTVLVAFALRISSIARASFNRDTIQAGSTGCHERVRCTQPVLDTL
jgi:hypothetical protein